MTTVDKYLNKYLEGSITELEMKEFRDLLESEPQLQLELRHTLDLRSLVHDDLLALNPPEAFSTNVKNLVGERFAALAEVEEEEEERRPPIFFTERIGGSMVMAMIALVLVALAPTLIAPSGSNRGGASDLAALERRDAASAQMEGSVAARPEGKESLTPSLFSTSSQRSKGAAQRGEGRRENAERISNNSLGTTEASNGSLAEVPNNGAAANPTTSINTPSDNPSAEGTNEDIVLLEGGIEQYTAVSTLPLPLGVLLESTVGQNELKWSRSISAAPNRAANMIEEGYDQANPQYPDYIAATTVPSVSDEYAYEPQKNFSPRIAFGFTVGAGALTHSSSVAVTQGAGYAAFSLSESNRIGIEAGGSKFRYTHTTYSQEITPLAKSNTTGVDEWKSAAGGGPDHLGGVYQIYGTSGRGNGGSTNNSTTEPNSQPGSINDPTQLNNGPQTGHSLFGGGNSAVIQPPSSASGVIRTHTYESDTSMGYGMLFYDRRIVSLNKELNIRSRVGVGGTDGGIILDMRAYAAFATNRNVAITLGVGGSALRELSQQGKLSANYGVQVGAELGF